LKVALTGASGFIGSHLVPLLEAEGFEVHCLTRSPKGFQFEHICELSNAAELTALLSKLRPDFVIHLASLAKPTRDLGDLEAQIRDTIVPTIALAKSIPSSVKLSLFFGSCEEYGNGPVPFKEDQALRNISPYGWAKISAFHATSMIASQRELRLAWIRPFLTFGPGQNTNQLVPHLIDRCLKGEEVMLSPGEQTRDFLYIEDLIGMVMAILKKPGLAEGQVINLCSGEPISVKVMAEQVKRICGSGRLNFGALAYRHNEAMTFFGSNEKFQALYGKTSLTPLSAALEKTVNAYRARR
jgi:UDP-glucose 4-epimerase